MARPSDTSHLSETTATVSHMIEVLGALPAEHPLAQQSRKGGSIAGARAFEELSATGQPIWLSWVDTSPSHGYGLPPTPGHLIHAAYFQQYRDPAVGEKAGTCHKTARRHTIDLGDGHVLTVPIWRHGRNDRPHTPACDGTATCAECGTGSYWLLPQYVWPPNEIGLADPTNSQRLHPGEKTMIGLGNRAVRLTDYARYARGMSGHPEPHRLGTISKVVEKERGDLLTVRWNDGLNSGYVGPRDLRRP